MGAGEGTGARGRLLVFEGTEGAGKTTQLHGLAERLVAVGIPHRRFREPGGTPLGESVRRILLDSALDIDPRAEALLFMAARAQLADLVREELGRGTLVLLDRFFLSTYAYQVAGRGLPEDDVRHANHLATGGLVPDLTVLLSLSDAEAARRVDARGGRDRIERAGDAFHARVVAAFDAFADPSWGAVHPEAGPLARVSADGTEAEVGRRVADLLVARWPETFAALRESQ